MSRVSATLADRRNDLSRQLMLDAAVAVLESGSFSDLTARSIARQANVSERTVFRYFPSREALVDAVADEVRRRMDVPPPPRTLEELQEAPGLLYRRFEAVRSLVEAALHTELFPRMRDTQARERWVAVRAIVDALAPRRSERERKIAAANIRYFLAATTWHYYRFSFGFTLDETIASAETAIRQTIDALKKR